MVEKAAKKTSTARNVVGLILLLAIGGAGISELWANRSYNAAVARLNERLGKNDPEAIEENPTRDEVNAILAKAPNPGGESKAKASYTWNGVFRKYTLTVEYEDQEPYHFTSFTTGGE